MRPAIPPSLLIEMYGLKALDRTGWVRSGIAEAESVAAHTWGNTLLALLFCPPELDRGKILAMVVLHDLAEVRVGDLTPQDGVSREEKHRRERDALAGLLGERPELLGLAQEYERGETPEAQFAREIDKLDMGVQAEVYGLQLGPKLPEFRASARMGLRRPELIEALEEVARESAKGRPHRPIDAACGMGEPK